MYPSLSYIENIIDLREVNLLFHVFVRDYIYFSTGEAHSLAGSIDGFVEGPALSPDERSLYYHRQTTGSGKFELYRVTRL
jgi:hypothetical protein